MNNMTFKFTLGAALVSTILGTAVASNLNGAQVKVLSAGNDLRQTIESQAKSSNQWFSYTVEMEAGNGSPCCYTNYRQKERFCSLDDSHSSWGSSHEDIDSETINVYFQWQDGKPEKLFFAGSDCPVEANNQSVISLSNVSQQSSVELLSSTVSQHHKKGKGRVLAAIAMHDGQYAQQALEQFSNHEHKKVRHNAIFWLGEARDKAGFDVLKEIVDDTSRPMKDRTKAIFAISENSYEGASKKLLQLATTTGNDKIQSKALFWLANSNNEQTENVIAQVLDSDASTKVKEKAVFALTQVKTEKAWEMLADLARNATQTNVQKKAIFWLSQESKGNDRDATPVLMEILNGPAPYSIKKKVVFALSQLPDEQGTQALLDVIKSDQSKAIKKKALFWLGQSNDPKAMEAIENILAAR